MKSMMRILTRYVLSAAGVTLLLLVLNFIILSVWTVQESKNLQEEHSVDEIAAGLTEKNGVFVFSEEAKEAVASEYQWAMLLDDKGTVIWSDNLPSDVPQSYTVADVASFSGWYLSDYPVYVWRHEDGLFVLGAVKGSYWKYKIEMPQMEMDRALVWLPVILIVNGLAAIILALLFGMRLFRSVKPLANGIDDMAKSHPVELATNGLLGDLAAGINQTSAQLTKQEIALNKRDNARTSWIAGVSHDIRTPLSLVMGYASQLENDVALPLSQREKAKIIRCQSERIKSLVNDLNLASKLEYEMQPLHYDNVAVAPLLRDVITDYLNSGLDDGFTLELGIDDDAQSVIVHGDEALLYRAVSNLIGNSIRHNPRGCTVKVTLRKRVGNCTIAIADDGTGFPVAILDELNNRRPSLDLENHGLGLTIVRQIVKTHHGTSSFSNLDSGGSLAMLCLPLSKENAQ